MATRGRGSRRRKIEGSKHGEQRSGPVAGTAFVDGVTFARKGLQYANVDGVAMFEGDIVLGKVEDVRQAEATGGTPLESVGITGQQFRWPNGVVVYDIDPALPNQQRVTDAIAHWEARTQIRFTLRTAANAAQHPNFVHFVAGGGCSSMVGMVGGSQDITLGSGCTAGNAIHEIGHSVGLWHEQSREDRDSFVQIVFPNIDPTMQHNFLQHIADGDDLGAYDYGSIMHYPPTAFSINNQATIIARQPLPPGVVMGQRAGLSQGDIAGVHMLYPGATIKEVTKDPIRDPVTIKELRKDPIQDTVKEVRKDPVTDPITIKELRKDPIQDTVKEVRKDPITDPITIPRPGFPPVVSPFVLGAPSRAPGAAQEAGAAAAVAQVQQLAASLAELAQHQADLAAAYAEAVQALASLGG
jgi:Astacin (Peptidase family M12A)